MPRQHTMRHVSPIALPDVRTVGSDRPLAWLQAGWEDLMRNPVASVGWGLVITLAYGLIIWFATATELYHIGVQLVAGFTLVAPILAVGFYALSRRIERERPSTFGAAMRAWGTNTKGFLTMGVLLVLIMLSWFMVSMQLYAFLAESKAELFLMGQGGDAATFGEFARALVTDLSIPLFLGFFLTGLLAALVVFAMTAVSVPMLLDRPEVDAFTAVVTSWNAVLHNWKTMLVWAALIVAVTAVGFLVFYIGLAVAVPLLGHATWHAYRELLGDWHKVDLPEVGYY